MAINRSFPLRFTPTGLVDAWDATEKFPGACQLLQNLIFDPSQPELVVSREGVTELFNLLDYGFINPSFISIQVIIGRRIFGMVATNRFPGYDEPFCLDLDTRALIPVLNVSAGNVPLSQIEHNTEWTPPTMASVGTMIIVTHPGFPGPGTLLWGGGELWGGGMLWGGSACFGYFDVTDPDAPVWYATNTVTTPLPAVPTAVANFNNRAWFAVGNRLWYSDVLTMPPTITNASQFLVLGDQSPITAISGLPLQTTSSGILQTLTALKATQVWQIAGDTVFGNLAQNYVSLNVGTAAPRSVVQTPQGLYFMATGGPYVIDQGGALRQVTHGPMETDPDIIAPFQNAIYRSRWAAGYASTVYRICGQYTIAGIRNQSDFWFDEARRRWTGPHTFLYDCVSQNDTESVLTSYLYPGLIIRSPVRVTEALNTRDIGTAMGVKLRSATFPKVGDMAMKQVTESQIELAGGDFDIRYVISAQNEQSRGIGQGEVFIAGPTVSPRWGYGALWGFPVNFYGGGSTWGSGIRYSTATGSGLFWGETTRRVPLTYPVPWRWPLVFEKLQIQIDATSSAAMTIGTFYARYQKTGYMTLGPNF